jgi:hypothetical protein
MDSLCNEAFHPVVMLLFAFQSVSNRVIKRCAPFVYSALGAIYNEVLHCLYSLSTFVLFSFFMFHRFVSLSSADSEFNAKQRVRIHLVGFLGKGIGPSQGERSLEKRVYTILRKHQKRTFLFRPLVRGGRL